VTTPQGVSWSEAIDIVTGPGQLFELTTDTVRGVPMQVFRHAPAHLGDLFALARRHGDKEFLVYEDERYDFRAVFARADGCADFLVCGLGLDRGDRVAVAMRNYPEWVMAFAGIVSSGLVSVSLNSWWTADEMDFALRDSGARVLICDEERYDVARKTCDALGIDVVCVRTDRPAGTRFHRWDDCVGVGADGNGPAHPGARGVGPDDDATILYTSGTTGRPKGAVSTHRAIISALMAFSCRQHVDGVRATSKPPADDFPLCFILIVPLFHVTGCVAVMLSSLVAGLKLVMMRKWDVVRALELIERERVTNFIGVPTQSWDLLNSGEFAKYDTSSLRSVGGGGAPAPATLVAKVAREVRTAGPQLGYGMTETNAYGPGNRGPEYVDRPTSTGRAVPPMKVEIRDENGVAVSPSVRGDIWLFGPMLFRGYWNRPDATEQALHAGWLRTGDIGHLDDEGFLYIEDRATDMILRGGENVYCAEVESAVYELPGIGEAAVFGVPDERLGEEVAVAIVPLRSGGIDAPTVWNGLTGRIAAFKVPTYVAILAVPLPRNAAGKVVKRQLREWVVSRSVEVTERP
jgi:long-chain acyl-CoA synthetase